MENYPTIPEHAEKVFASARLNGETREYKLLVHTAENIILRRLIMQGPTNPKEAAAWLRKQTAFFEYEKGKVFVDASVVDADMRSFKVGVRVLQAYATKKGRIYMFRHIVGGSRPDDNNVQMAYTAHFFDRYSERHGLTTSRSKTICHFMRKQKNYEKVDRIIEDDGSFVMNYEGGLGMGTIYTPKEGEGYLYITVTYVAEAMLNKKQEMRYLLLGLNEELREEVMGREFKSVDEVVKTIKEIKVEPEPIKAEPPKKLSLAKRLLLAEKNRR